MFHRSDSCKCVSFREEEWIVISETTANINIFLGSLGEGVSERSQVFLIRNK